VETNQSYSKNFFLEGSIHTVNAGGSVLNEMETM
jgi:hypothetical protein